MKEPGVEALVEQVAHLLPAQGPISIFIHHNTLHAFEDRPFEDAVVEAGRLFGCRPFLPEENYREELARGRITESELRDVVTEELGPRGAETLGAGVTRQELAWVAARHGIPEVGGPALRWLLEELDALERFRTDVPPEARDAFASVRGAGDVDGERAWLKELWGACLATVERAGPPRSRAAPRLCRHRDLLLAARGADIDDEVHPFMVRFVGAYLDQGLSLWPMPSREQGMLASFLACYRRPLARYLLSFGRELLPLLEAHAGQSAAESIAGSLDALGVERHERFRFLLETALALRGWAGMVRQIEERPDRVPVRPVPARLDDFLAIRLLVERAVLAKVARPGPVSRLREQLRAEVKPEPPRSPAERAWPLFQACQLLGLEPSRLAALSSAEAAGFEVALEEYGSGFCRRVLHLGYERQLRRRFFDVVTQHPPRSVDAPVLQVVTCVDEREESLRRHLEEVEPGVETLSTAGFFGVPMYFKGSRDARPRPLAPVTIKPAHYVELETAPAPVLRSWREQLGRLRGQAVHVGSRGLFRGALVSIMGSLSLVPLVLRVLFPARRRVLPLIAAKRDEGNLAVHRLDAPPPIGAHRGFSTVEMAGIVQRVLGDLGLTRDRLAPLVVVMGHASDSLNNPHRSAYDCGACGGGPGGANARAFAKMANDPMVRAELDRRGAGIPPQTWFVGAEHNTTGDSIDYFDLERAPPTHAGALARARAWLDVARARNAQERCRRFASVPPLSPEAALAHVEGRRSDLAEPRPEYNHATNAVCVVGRRARTRGLFLDRRAFLVSYDPTTDDDAGTVLARVLGAITPVLAGINLEYFFGTLDNEGYGAGTKLPHNVSALVGVMNGPASDLRTGLWSQTVEIHEPVRLSMIVEAPPARLERVVEADAYLKRLVAHRWLFLAALDPSGPALWKWQKTGPEPYRPGLPPNEVLGPSSTWFRGKRGHLPFVEIGAAP